MRATSLCLIVIIGFVVSCQHQGSTVFQSEVGLLNPWTHTNFLNDPSNFQFAIVADRTGGLRKGVFAEAVDKLNLLQPEFVISVGDLIVGWDEDQKDFITDRMKIKSRWEEFNRIASNLQSPFFYVGGNNDLLNPILEKEWNRQFAKTYYSFQYQEVLFVILNSDDTSAVNEAALSESQITWLKSTLGQNKHQRWTLLFLHRPLWIDAPNEWAKVKPLLDDRNHTVFAGHHHVYRKHTRDKASYYQLGTTGGSSGLLGPIDGQFDHITWVTMTNDGPIVSNLMLDGIWGDNPIGESSKLFEFTTYYQLYGSKKALTKLDSLKRIYPDHHFFGSVQMNMLVNQLIKQDQAKEALKIANTNFREYPNSLPVLRWLSEAQLLNKDTTIAISTIEKIIDLDEGNAWALQKLSTIR